MWYLRYKFPIQRLELTKLFFMWHLDLIVNSVPVPGTYLNKEDSVAPFCTTGPGTTNFFPSLFFFRNFGFKRERALSSNKIEQEKHRSCCELDSWPFCGNRICFSIIHYLLTHHFLAPRTTNLHNRKPLIFLLGTDTDFDMQDTDPHICFGGCTCTVPVCNRVSNASPDGGFWWCGSSHKFVFKWNETKCW